MLQNTLKDKEDEIRMMAAWSLFKIGEEKQGLSALDQMLFNKCENVNLLHNIIDWMGKPALPLAKKYIERGGSRKGKYAVSILGRVAQLNGW